MKYIHFDTINSTNTYLKENYLSLEHLTVVSASHQTQGRGRNGRFWYDEDDAMFSILLKENISNPTDYTFIAALTVLKVLNFYNLKPLIKWPNDLYVNDKKIAGILLEGVIKDNKQACVIIGIGVNTNSISFNNEYRVPPTSIKLETDQEVNNIDFIKKCGEEFINLLKKY